MDSESKSPGGEMEFRDVTGLFLKAAAELEPNNLLFMEDFTLQDSMSALEIGEPRLDSGLIVQDQLKPPFNPLMPLLPEELCWILDRSLGYETEFHAGNFLAHTIHTLLYVHHLGDIDPDILPQSTSLFISQSASTPTFSNERPIEFVTIVLRAAVQGLLKCCSLSWSELIKGGTFDTEDWQSDKCEISLLEGTPAPFVISKLDEAANWLRQSGSVSGFWKTALQARILFRKALLQIMSAESTTSQPNLYDLIQSAREQLFVIQKYSPECSPESPAQSAFDPYIGRRLQMFTPIRVIPPPDLQKTCDAIRRLLDGFDEISLLRATNQLLTWETVGHLRLWLPNSPVRVPYLRSLTQSTFHDEFLTSHRHTSDWMVNQFFRETIGVDYDSISEAILARWTGSESSAPLNQLDRVLHKLMPLHIKALWHNPPRRRRYFMKSLVGWHELYDLLTQIRDNLDLEETPEDLLITRLPDVALLWRLSVVREVILSGFQLELYSREEKPFAYWYAVEVIDTHLSCLDNLTSIVPQDTAAYREMVYQTQFLTALRSICAALSTILMPLVSFDWARMRPNFYRRYKWAFRPDYDDSQTPVVAQPELYRFMKALDESMKGGGMVPSNFIELARTILLHLVTSNKLGGYAGLWVQDRMQFLQNMIVACDNLEGLPLTSDEMDEFDPSLLKWNPCVHPWFPVLVSLRTTTSMG